MSTMPSTSGLQRVANRGLELVHRVPVVTERTHVF
jgi:hypothetical protein